MRTFIAIELPKEIKDYLAAIQEELRKSGAEVKWVQPQNIHLTLKFLGEIDDKKLDKITYLMEDVIKDRGPFKICISFLGAFPKINFPRVIWVGLDQGDHETKEIAKALEEKIECLGIPKETRPFSSHITIGRLRSAQNCQNLVQDLKSMADNIGKQNLEFSVSRITLFKSTLTPKGPIYEALKEASLKTA